MLQSLCMANKLTKEERDELLSTLQTRFHEYKGRHKGMQWEKVSAKLKGSSRKLWSLFEMERTGGEPDVAGYDKKTGEFIFFDFSDESPAGRRSLCFDAAALKSRKEHKPEDSALGMAKAMGIELLSEAEYRTLQKLKVCDLKTSSWIATPAPIRKLGGALFCDRRYDTVFLYHNGAESYYASRGFRGVLRV